MPVEYRLEPCRSALNRVTGMAFRWSLNPYMGCAHRCTFCYVRAFERRADRPSDDRYGRSIRVKTNVVDVLRAELSRRSWTRETVFVGAATDPYQPAEGRFKLTRGCLEAFAERANPFGIITRGPMVIRDIDVLQSASQRADVSVTLSIPTLDEEIWRVTEPGTAHPRQRFRAVRALADAGIKVNVALAPILPGLSDKVELLAEVVRAARDAGAVKLWTILLHMQSGTREHFLETLADVWPEQAAQLTAVYSQRAYAPEKQQQAVAAEVTSILRLHPRRASAPDPIVPEPPRVAIQLGLALEDAVGENRA